MAFLTIECGPSVWSVSYDMRLWPWGFFNSRKV